MVFRKYHLNLDIADIILTTLHKDRVVSFVYLKVDYASSVFYVKVHQHTYEFSHLLSALRINEEMRELTRGLSGLYTEEYL
jgi:hypothetical protein